MYIQIHQAWAVVCLCVSIMWLFNIWATSRFIPKKDWEQWERFDAMSTFLSLLLIAFIGPALLLYMR